MRNPVPLGVRRTVALGGVGSGGPALARPGRAGYTFARTSRDRRCGLIDEVLYMQVRLFRMFCERSGVDPRQGNELFKAGDVWDFISSCYDYLHLSGDEAALDDVYARLRHAGVAW